METPDIRGIQDFKLTEDELGYLRQLKDSGAWKVYRRLLNDQCVRYLWSAMPEKDPYILKEKVSIAAGLNLSINLLERLTANNNKDKDVSGQA